MSNKQVVSVKSGDIEELISLLTLKFDDSETMGVDMLMLCFVVGELCVKIHSDNWAYKESFKKSIKMMKRMAEKIANDVYEFGKGVDFPEDK